MIMPSAFQELLANSGQATTNVFQHPMGEGCVRKGPSERGPEAEFTSVRRKGRVCSVNTGNSAPSLRGGQRGMPMPP